MLLRAQVRGFGGWRCLQGFRRSSPTRRMTTCIPCMLTSTSRDLHVFSSDTSYVYVYVYYTSFVYSSLYSSPFLYMIIRRVLSCCATM